MRIPGNLEDATKSLRRSDDEDLMLPSPETVSVGVPVAEEI
jgi:hypothetical protein